MTDPIAKQLSDRLHLRADLGLKKYGVSLDAAPLTIIQTLEHYIEEMLDGASYAQRVVNELRKREGSFW